MIRGPRIPVYVVRLESPTSLGTIMLAKTRLMIKFLSNTRTVTLLPSVASIRQFLLCSNLIIEMCIVLPLLIIRIALRLLCRRVAGNVGLFGNVCKSCGKHTPMCAFLLGMSDTLTRLLSRPMKLKITSKLSLAFRLLVPAAKNGLKVRVNILGDTLSLALRIVMCIQLLVITFPLV